MSNVKSTNCIEQNIDKINKLLGTGLGPFCWSTNWLTYPEAEMGKRLAYEWD